MPDLKKTDQITAQEGLGLLKTMLLIRRFEEQAAEQYSKGKIQGFLHLYIGEEAVAVGAIPCLKPEDAIISTYREHGHALARGISAGAIMAEMFGKANGCSRGRGGSMHIFDASKRFFGGNAIVAGGLPLAVGMALADKMQRNDHVTMCIFGDGAVAEGEFHESLNLAALWKLPVLFLCENNDYAMGTHLVRHQAQADIAAKAKSYGMPAEVIDGMDILAVRTGTQSALDTIRNGEGPCFLEIRTYRFRAHSMYDAELYRNKNEVEAWKQRDPIQLFITHMTSAGLMNAQDLQHLEDRVAEEIRQAIETAETGPWEPIEDLLKDVHTPVSI